MDFNLPEVPPGFKEAVEAAVNVEVEADREEARRAEADGANYIAVGSIFPTSSKAITRAATLDRLREVKAAVRVPVVAIGGITASNIDSVIAAGADATAVISAVCGAHDPRAAALELVAALSR